MKFLCDKCKTRYSIGDDRVRGKILKIRCKNCANVITVREGADAGDEPGRPRVPTGQQPPLAEAPRPPAALEEEWYVSIEGVQSGPLSLTAAQAWVSAKPFDADLHCWSEGFDDWLPVDKVSHFRGLRKAPPPKPMPPPRPSGTHKTAPPPIPSEPAPKPLFASTMASLEKAAASQPSMPAASAAPLAAQATKKSAPLPAITAKAPSGPIKTNGAAAPLSAGAAALAQAFQPEPDAMTNIDAPAFDDSLPTTAAEPSAASSARMAAQGASAFYGAKPAPAKPDPFAAKPALPKPDPFAAKPAAPKADPFAAAAPKPVMPIHNDDEDNLEIGEVSRVVNLKDLVAKPKPVERAATASFNKIGAATGSVQRIGGNTASVQKLTPSELGMKVDPALASSLGAATGEPHADESIVARSFRERHRRGMIALIGASAALVVGVILLFVFVVNKNNDDEGGGLGGTHQIDTSRPEDIVRQQLPPAPNAGSNAAGNNTKRWIPRPNGNNVAQNPNNGNEEPAGNALKASEVEDMAAKQGEGTKRCYMRAQKGALGFEIADVKKIAVTLSVNKDGSVGDVQLSEHAGDTFGQCLIARIKGWKFHESGGGTFRISLAFSNE